MYVHHGLFVKISIRTTQLTYRVGFSNITIGETSYKVISRLALAQPGFGVLALRLAFDSNGNACYGGCLRERLATSHCAPSPL